MEDQLKKASNETLKFLLTKLNPKVEHEGKFYSTLQRPIEYNKKMPERPMDEKRKRNDLLS